MDFRLYDGALGRFFGIDLLADMFTDHSPYHFGYNNPISFMDPTGLSSTDDGDLLDEIIINYTPPQVPPGGGFTIPLPFFGNWYDQVGIYNPNNPDEGTVLPEIIIDPKPKEQEAKNDYRQMYDGLSNIGNVISVGEIISGLGNAKFTMGILSKAGLGVTLVKTGVGATTIYKERNSNNKSLSVGEFAYDTTGALTGTIGGTIVGAEFGSLPGAAFGFAVGVYFDFGKMVYEGYLWLQHEAGVWRDNLVRSVMSNPYYR